MKSTEKPLVNVITPVYNGEPFLAECIESVLAQTYTHWDYTLIDNRSNDGTLKIAQRYAAQHPRIRVIRNPAHVGVIQNHNIAFRQISSNSKYCKVVHADDWLYPECIEKMVSLAETNPKIAIVGSYALFSRKPAIVGFAGLPYSCTIDRGGREACRMRLLGGPYVFGTASTLLFRSDILRSRHAFYNESNIHADSEACFEFLGERDFGFVHQVLSFRREQGGTTINFSQSFNTYLPGILLELVKYGAKYLSKSEQETRINAHLRDYYNYLGWEVYKFRERRFWDYHREKLAELGYPLSNARIMRAAILNGLEVALNPKHAVEAAVRRLGSAFSKATRRRLEPHPATSSISIVPNK